MDKVNVFGKEMEVSYIKKNIFNLCAFPGDFWNPGQCNQNHWNYSANTFGASPVDGLVVFPNKQVLEYEVDIFGEMTVYLDGKEI